MGGSGVGDLLHVPSAEVTRNHVGGPIPVPLFFASDLVVDLASPATFWTPQMTHVHACASPRTAPTPLAGARCKLSMQTHTARLLGGS